MNTRKAYKWHFADGILLDILLHQSGHIMLSDFDLAKQSDQPGGWPVMVQSSETNGVSLLVSRNYLNAEPVTDAYD